MRQSCKPPSDSTVNFRGTTVDLTQQSLVIPADTTCLAQIGKLLEKVAQKAGFNEMEIGDVLLAVDEACTNTIKHSLKSDPTRKFQMDINCQTGNIEIIIHEDGVDFDPSQVETPDLDLPLDKRPIGGLGVYFIQKLMDHVEYKMTENGVKMLRMVKNKD